MDQDCAEMTLPLMNIDDPESRAAPRVALFNLGFRPFFLLAGISAFLLIPLWILFYTRGTTEFGYYTATYWHSHEMLFGYTVAVIAGFLLTAVRNWTDMPTPGGKALAGLVLLWLAGRIAPFVGDDLPDWMIAALDIAFLPILAISLSVPLLRRRQTRNLVFLFILSALMLANVLVHVQLLGITQATVKPGLNLAIYLIVLLIAILGGRVIPFFTERGIVGATTRQWKAVEYLARQPAGPDVTRSGERLTGSNSPVRVIRRPRARDTSVRLVPQAGLVSPVALGLAPGVCLAGRGVPVQGIGCGRSG
jgi:uncharacterized protein involved in response to NO